MRATVSYASNLAGDNTDKTKNEALVIIYELIPYVSVKTIEIIDNNLVELTPQEKDKRIVMLADMIKEICEFY
ncbi:hypothetical protein [Gelidibacter pelagius]|uniref:Uncharacterized protein n=1 Tax=Gelidibacter pelagius TaxID=2819985 RepID=A0ABS3SSJ2_9FLAO|nr:hypothetical protein [Gelidibacter pelagius]MBO3097853.1 hypothetical protein [Gelidibacter pelagius]